MISLNATVPKLCFMGLALLRPLSCGHYYYSYEENVVECDSCTETDSFNIVIYSSVAVAIPLILDVSSDMFTPRRLLNQLFARAIICLALVFPACLHIHFSLNQHKVFATWVIINMRSTINASLMLHQLQYRSRSVIPSKFYYIVLIMFQIGSVLRAYIYSSMVVHIVGRFLRILSLFGFYCLTLKRMYLVMYKGDLAQEWYVRWQLLAFEFLVLVTAVATAIQSYLNYDPNRNIVEADTNVIEGIYITGTFF